MSPCNQVAASSVSKRCSSLDAVMRDRPSKCGQLAGGTHSCVPSGSNGLGILDNDGAAAIKARWRQTVAVPKVGGDSDAKNMAFQPNQVLCECDPSDTDEWLPSEDGRSSTARCRLRPLSQPRQRRSRSCGVEYRQRCKRNRSESRVSAAADAMPELLGHRKSRDSLEPSDLEKVRCHERDTPVRQPAVARVDSPGTSSQPQKHGTSQRPQTGVKRRAVGSRSSTRIKRKRDAPVEAASCSACWKHGVPRTKHAHCPFAACSCWMCSAGSPYPRLLLKHGVTKLCAVSLPRFADNYTAIHASSPHSPRDEERIEVVQQPTAPPKTSLMPPEQLCSIARDSDSGRTVTKTAKTASPTTSSSKICPSQPGDEPLAFRRKGAAKTSGCQPLQLCLRRTGCGLKSLAWVCVPRSTPPRHALGRGRLGSNRAQESAQDKEVQRLGVCLFPEKKMTPRRLRPLPRRPGCREKGGTRLRMFRDHIGLRGACESSRCDAGLSPRKETPDSASSATSTPFEVQPPQGGEVASALSRALPSHVGAGKDISSSYWTPIPTGILKTVFLRVPTSVGTSSLQSEVRCDVMPASDLGACLPVCDVPVAHTESSACSLESSNGDSRTCKTSFIPNRRKMISPLKSPVLSLMKNGFVFSSIRLSSNKSNITPDKICLSNVSLALQPSLKDPIGEDVTQPTDEEETTAEPLAGVDTLHDRISGGESSSNAAVVDTAATCGTCGIPAVTPDKIPLVWSDEFLASILPKDELSVEEHARHPGTEGLQSSNDASRAAGMSAAVATDYLIRRNCHQEPASLPSETSLFSHSKAMCDFPAVDIASVEESQQKPAMRCSSPGSSNEVRVATTSIDLLTSEVRNDMSEKDSRVLGFDASLKGADTILTSVPVGEGTIGVLSSTPFTDQDTVDTVAASLKQSSSETFVCPLEALDRERLLGPTDSATTRTSKVSKSVSAVSDTSMEAELDSNSSMDKTPKAHREPVRSSALFSEISEGLESPFPEANDVSLTQEPRSPLVAFRCDDLQDTSGLADELQHECAWCGRAFATAAEVESHSVKHAEPEEEIDDSGEAPEGHDNSNSLIPLCAKSKIRVKPWCELAASQLTAEPAKAVGVSANAGDALRPQLSGHVVPKQRQILVLRVPQPVGAAMKIGDAIRFEPGRDKPVKALPGGRFRISSVKKRERRVVTSSSTVPPSAVNAAGLSIQTPASAEGSCVNVFFEHEVISGCKRNGHNEPVKRDAHVPFKPTKKTILRCSYPFKPTKKTILRCSYCPAICRSREGLAVHRMHYHAFENLFRCVAPNCPSIFNSSLQQRIHSAIAHPLLRFSCLLCSAYLPSTLLLEAHLETEHKKSPVSLPCPLCPAGGPSASTSIAALEAHFTRSHPGRLPLTCVACGWQTSSMMAMLSHHRAHQQVLRTMHCPVCVAWFPLWELLQAHMDAEHLKGTAVECPVCKECFKAAGALSRHLRSRHANALPYECACGQGFRTAGQLYEHALQTLHMAGLSSPQFASKCTSCGYVTSDPIEVREHHDSVHLQLVPLDRMVQLMTLIRDAQVIKGWTAGEASSLKERTALGAAAVTPGIEAAAAVNSPLNGDLRLHPEEILKGNANFT